MLREVKSNEFEGGAAFVDGDWVPLSEAKLSLFDWGLYTLRCHL
jgi:branched-chain amino acid aminotransferase